MLAVKSLAQFVDLRDGLTIGKDCRAKQKAGGNNQDIFNQGFIHAIDPLLSIGFNTVSQRPTPRAAVRAPTTIDLKLSVTGKSPLLVKVSGDPGPDFCRPQIYIRYVST